jgi:hypothetical protein
MHQASFLTNNFRRVPFLGPLLTSGPPILWPIFAFFWPAAAVGLLAGRPLNSLIEQKLKNQSNSLANAG